MRVVAKVQLTTLNGPDDLGASALRLLERWADRKFIVDDAGAFRIRASGLQAQWDQRADSVGDVRLDRVCVLEPVERGSLQMDVDLLADAHRTAFRCILRVGSDAGVAPTDVQVRAPRFVREIVALPCSWTVGAGGEAVFAHPFFIDVDELPVLDELMVSPVRRLPVVIVSEHDGETLAGDLHEKLAHDLCGLAHVVRLSTEASWALTHSRGKEWSCYNGAVRLFWPFRANMPDFRAHPLWTYDLLAARFETEQQAREHLRRELARRILEASTFVADDPKFDEFAAMRSHAALDTARAAAAEGGDFRQLADAYAVENDELRAKVDDQREQIDLLRQQVEALNPARHLPPAETGDERGETPPQTVAEAVSIARHELAGTVAIAFETDVDIAHLNPAAGPPDKILRYVRTLGNLATALANGPIGLSVPQWLKARNVECSVDSETTKLSKEGKRFRNRPVNGEPVDCEYHLKPADKVRPDMCARIYFATATTAPFVKVGYIGRHID